MSADLKLQFVVVRVIFSVHKTAETEGPVCTSRTYLRTYQRILGFLPLLQGLPPPACFARLYSSLQRPFCTSNGHVYFGCVYSRIQVRDAMWLNTKSWYGETRKSVLFGSFFFFEFCSFIRFLLHRCTRRLWQGWTSTPLSLIMSLHNL